MAEQLPPQLGTDLLDSAREAFIQGMRVSSAVAAVVAVGICVLAVTMLRHVRSPSETASPERDVADERETVDAVVGADL